ncbi:aminoacyl-tRNA hydrolase [Treponema sp. TIM-1]|uniref:aminoacyl-tRNA hydrolase n=1 Tax=Treponema sp. TIM-1 TaxID=2898417 RepID=UPI0039808475
MIALAAFLGNPGEEYRGNRHNAGRLLAEALPFFSSLDWKKKYRGLYAALAGDLLRTYAGPGQETGENPGGPAEKVHLLLPETYMNRSGDSVLAAAAFFKIEPEHILVVHDELELSLGQLSLKFSGGLGGHNGLRSMKARFGTADFWRLRIGIGRPNHDDISGWVLSDFSPQERTVLDPVLEAAAGVLIQALAFGPQGLLPEWNKKKIAMEI